MARSRGGNGRHRQAWILAACPYCGDEVRQRRTLPGKPLHIKAHWNGEEFCPPLTVGRQVKGTMIVHDQKRVPAEGGQLELFG